MRRHLPFLVVLLLTAAARFAILFQSQTHVHSDEAIIGLMGKHILEGRYLPFYMYGQAYNAGAAWEAYFAAIPFAAFGVGVIPLKGAMVVLSLACLAFFYRTTLLLYDRRTALLATLLFALSPSLLKWHFQVRGYSWYFLSIPILTGLFFSIASGSPVKAKKVFLFGLVSGLAVWNLELTLSLVGACWVLLAVGRKLSLKHAALGAAGFIAGYAPAIFYNVTHHFSNWLLVFGGKTGGVGRFSPVAILFEELPKFFGPDTTLWYYPEKPASGYVFYAIALLAVAAAIAPFVKRPAKLRELFSAAPVRADEHKDFILLLLTAACAVPYVVAPIRVPGYFLGGCFFLSMLAGRLAARSFAIAGSPGRIVGVSVLAAAALAGTVAMIETARQDQIETLTFDQQGNIYLSRFPGADIEAVQRQLREDRIASVWTTVSFVYPLLFESRETLAVSDSIFGWGRAVYPAVVPRRQPAPEEHPAFVVETDSPLRASAEARCAEAGGGAPVITEHGTLTVIEERPRTSPR